MMKLFFAFSLFFACALCPAACAGGVREGLALAAGQALPALFPFFAASGLLVRCGLVEAFSGLAARPLAVLYGLPPAAAPAVLLGLTGGYPVGAATAAELVSQDALDAETAARVNTFCNCASPGFCIGLVGLGVFGSARTGAILYGVHIAATLLTGLFTARGAMPPERAARVGKRPDTPFSAAFCGAVQQAAATSLTVTAFITMFSILLALLEPILGALPCGSVLAGVIELTNGLDALPLLPLPSGALLTFASFLLGFGGLAVQFQVRAIAAPQGIGCGLFLPAKLLHGTIAAALTALLFRLSPEALTVFAPMQYAARHSGRTALVLAAALLLLARIGSGKAQGNTL